MIFLVGGAPRVGKSILAQHVAANLKAGWISTDLLAELLKLNHVEGVTTEWNASPEAIRALAEWFFPSLERFIWGVSSMAENYVIEGVSFLPEQATKLATQYQIRAIFLGRAEMSLETLDRFPGRSPGYGYLAEEMRRQIAGDVPLWSAFIRQEAGRWGQPYVDMSGDFAGRLQDADAALTTGIGE